MAGPWNLQGPAVDFSPLGQLYAGFIGAQDHAIKRRQDEEAGPALEKMLNAYAAQQGAGAQPGSLSALAAQAQGGAVPKAPSFASGTGYAAELPVKSADQIKRASDYGSYLTKQGENPNVAAGLIGNAWHESGGLSPTVRGDNGASIGLFQFHEKGRQPALRQWASQTGRDINDPYAQLDFVRHDLQTNFPQTYAKMQAARDPGEATRIFMAEYERPAASAAYLDRRLARANQAYGLLNQQTAAVAPGFTPQLPPEAAAAAPMPMQRPAPMQLAQANMPTQNPNGGDPTTGFNTPIGQDVYAQGFNAPLNTAVPLGRPAAPSAPGTMQAQAQTPDPRANAFGSGDPTQSGGQAGFYIPGTDPASGPPRPPPPVPAPAPAAPAGLPGAAAATGGGMQPEFRAALAAGLRNPQTRAAALELWKQAASPQSQYDFQVAGDQMYRVNKRTGAYEAIAGVNQKPVTVGEGASLVDPQTGRVVFQGQPKNEATSTQKEYAQAVKDGFKGSLLEYQTALAEAKRIQVNNNLPGGEKSYDTKVGGDYGEQFVTYQKAGRAAASTKNTLALMDRLTRDPSFYSGFGGERQVTINRALAALGVKDPKAAAPSEVFGSLVNDVVLGKLGGSLGAGVSNADVGFMQQTAPNLANTKEGNRLLISLTGRMMDRQQEIAKLSRDYAKTHGRIDAGFDAELADFAEANPLFTEADYKAAQAAMNGEPAGSAPATTTPGGNTTKFNEGQTATGPGGKKIIYRGGTWVPLQ